MKKYFSILMAALLFLSSSLLALHRDYKADCDEDNRYQFYCDKSSS